MDGGAWAAAGALAAGFVWQIRILKKGEKATGLKVDAAATAVTETVTGVVGEQGKTLSAQFKVNEKLLKDALRRLAQLEKYVGPPEEDPNSPEKAPFVEMTQTQIKVEEIPKSPLGKVIIKP